MQSHIYWLDRWVILVVRDEPVKEIFQRFDNNPAPASRRRRKIKTIELNSVVCPNLYKFDKSIFTS